MEAAPIPALARVRRLERAIIAGDADAARLHLAQLPEAIRQRLGRVLDTSTLMQANALGLFRTEMPPAS